MKIPYQRSGVFLHAVRSGRNVSSLSPTSYIKTQEPKICESSVKPFKDIPGPPRLPVWGNLLLYKFGKYDGSQYHKVISQLYHEYGPIVREDLGPNNTIIHIYRPDDARTVYSAESRMPIIMPLMDTIKIYRARTDRSLGLGNANGEEWYRLRKAVRHLMLQPREVSQYLPEVDSVARLMTDRILQQRDENGEVISLNVDIGKWAQESAGRICFGRSLGCLSNGPEEKEMDKIIQCNREMFRLSSILKFSLPLYMIMPTPRWRRLVKNEDVVVNFAERQVNTAVEEIRQLMKEGKQLPERLSFMSHLLAADNLSGKDITIISLSLFLDGLSTTVPALLFNLYKLATNPEAQERAYDEIRSALPDPDEPVTFKILGNLPFIKAVVKETFRTLPVGTEVSRVLEKDLVLSGYHVPAGTHVNINMNVNFQSEEFFPEPDKFKPERWLRSDDSKHLHPYVLTPFGHGTRTCAGRRFAEQDLYVLLSRIVRKFKMSYPENSDIRPVFHTLLFPGGPVRVRFTPR